MCGRGGSESPCKSLAFSFLWLRVELRGSDVMYCSLSLATLILKSWDIVNYSRAILQYYLCCVVIPYIGGCWFVLLVCNSSCRLIIVQICY